MRAWCFLVGDQGGTQFAYSCGDVPSVMRGKQVTVTVEWDGSGSGHLVKQYDRTFPA